MRERGDTLVEVLIAVAMLSLVLVGALRVMSAGEATAINSVERTQVQALLASQQNLVRYFRDEFIRAGNLPNTPAAQDWQAIVPYLSAAPIDSNACSGTIRNAFYIAENLASVTPANQLTVTSFSAPLGASGAPRVGNGAWIEARRVTVGASIYVDFVAKACWQPVGGSSRDESKTVMRLTLP